MNPSPQNGDRHHLQPNKAFLDLFPESRRSGVMNAFLAQVRAGECRPEMIVNRVWAAATAKAKVSTPDERTKHLGLCLAIENHPDAAVALAEYGLWWESLLPAEKSRQKAESGERHRAEWMQRQAATPKQMMFLRQLGHRGPVGDRQAASEEIARRLAGTRR